MDNYRIKILRDLTTQKNCKLRENIIQCLSRQAFEDRTYRTTQTQKEKHQTATRLKQTGKKIRGADCYSCYGQRVSYASVTSHYISSRQEEISVLLSILTH